MDEVVKIKFEAMEQENERQNHRIGKLEENVREIQKLTLSVQKLADSMERMLAEQTKQGKRLEALETKPLEDINAIRRTVMTAVVSAIAGAFALGVIQMIAQNM